MMVLKYEAELRVRPDQPCPCPSRYQQRALTAFRYLRRDATGADFLPVALLDGVKAKDRCNKFALSFFVAREQAVARYKDLVARLGSQARAIERYGDHVGRVQLTAADGLCCEADRTGHFDLHEAAGVDWAERVEEYIELRIEV